MNLVRSFLDARRDIVVQLASWGEQVSRMAASWQIGSELDRLVKQGVADAEEINRLLSNFASQIDTCTVTINRVAIVDRFEPEHSDR